MKNTEINKIISEKVQEEVARLKKSEVNELFALPKYSAITFSIGEKTQELGVWCEIQNDEALIAVQCKNNKILGIGKMHSDSFIITRAGEIKQTPEDIKWQFT